MQRVNSICRNMPGLLLHLHKATAYASVNWADSGVSQQGDVNGLEEFS